MKEEELEKENKKKMQHKNGKFNDFKSSHFHGLRPCIYIYMYTHFGYGVDLNLMKKNLNFFSVACKSILN